MASSLAAQLSNIAANSTKSLNLKAQKAAHGQSLIFEPRVAASQSFDSIYLLCHEGFQELCLLDGRFLEFQRTIFSEQSQEEDRTQMTAAQNEELDNKLEAFLGLVGGRIRLNPAVKAVEWLVRRFRIHDYNTSFLLTTFLPYHTLPIFTTLLSILPKNIPSPYRFLEPCIRSLVQPQRHTIVYTTIKNPTFESLLNSYVLRICKKRQHYPALLSFWAGVMTEAVSGMLDKSRSGQRNVQAQNEHDILLRLLPTLNEGLAMKKVPELHIGCYMLLSVMASKGGLEDKLLSAMMEAVVLSWTTDTYVPALVCLSILAQQRDAKRISRSITKELLKVERLPDLLVEISQQRRVDKLANGLCLALIDRLDQGGDIIPLLTVEHVVKSGILIDSQTNEIVKALLLAVQRLDDSVDQEGSTRTALAKLFVSLVEGSGRTSVIVRGAMDDASVDIDDLEIKLQTTLRPKLLPAPSAGDTEMNDEQAADTVPSATVLISALRTETIDEKSFLSHRRPQIYDSLCTAFLTSVVDAEAMQKFETIPLLRQDYATTEALYFSFFIRVWCGPYPVLARVAALQATTRRLRSVERFTVDFQAMIPYALAALSDPATKVRRASAELVIALDHLYLVSEGVTKEQASLHRWGADEIYGNGQDMKHGKWLSIDHASRLLHSVLLPALEECIIDKDHLDTVVENCLNSSKSEVLKKGDLGRPSQTLRASILLFLASHAINTPIYLLKLRLLTALNRVRGVASTTRTKVLLPLLQQWATLRSQEAEKYLSDEKIDHEKFDNEVAGIVAANDAEGVDYLASVISGEISLDRPKLVSAAFLRIAKLWPALKGDIRLSISQTLLEISQTPAGNSTSSSIAQAEAMGLLQTLPLSTDILLSFLNQLPTSASLSDQPPATKRRRISHGEAAKVNLQNATQLTGSLKKVTFVLQLINSSNPKEHVALLGGLFNALAELLHFKSQVGSELGYLQDLVLSSLLAIMEAYKADHSLKLNRPAVRADLLVDCVQKTSSPQVQNAALLMIASLAETAPELVLHSVMPIFTFMGSSVLRQNDEYSAHVIKQTISKVIPPLIESLRKEKGDPVTGAAELLLSFVAAYEHIPSHRRKGLFNSLVCTLGPEDFLFALLAMLADKYGVTDDVKAFSLELYCCFNVDVQLQTVLKHLDLIDDILKPKPTISASLLIGNESGVREPNRLALSQLALLPNLLSQRRLITQMGKILDQDDMDSSRIRELYSMLLEKVLLLADTLKSDKRLHGPCSDLLESLLGLLSTGEFTKAVESLLDRPNNHLRRKILRSLEVRIDHENKLDAESRVAMLNFLPQLTAIIRESTDILYKHTAVACVDKISEKYGKKDLEAVAAAAQTIASEHCLGQEDGRLRVMAMLCLASLVDILREAIVPVLPIAMNKTLEYMEGSVKEDYEDSSLHNAGFSFISALTQHLPYMITGPYLERLLSIANNSAEAELDEEADECRKQCLQLAAKQIEAKLMFLALQKNWRKAADSGALALYEYLDVLSTAIDKHPKSAVTKNSPVLTSIFLNALDLRREWTLQRTGLPSSESINEVESSINAAAIKMIYKFNDSTFRPIFLRLVEWASSGLPKKDMMGRILRLQSTYSFFTVFFESLKSIVTSYATYLVENIAEILQTVDSTNEESKELWTRALRTLLQCFKYDQDDFWQSPAHFNAIAPALMSQFLHASHLPLVEAVLPAIVELAAVADSAEHHKELNSAILQHTRSENANVRLAAIKCEEALADRLGEEWLSMLPEMLPFISELQEDSDEVVERQTQRLIVKIEGVLGESLDSMLQ